MCGAWRALAVTSPVMSSLVKTGGCAAVQPRAPARQVKANRGEDSKRGGARAAVSARPGGARQRWGSGQAGVMIEASSEETAA
jgi:hypothetical protein